MASWARHLLGTNCTWGELANGALRACIEAKKFTHGQLDQIKHLSPRVRLSIACGLEAEQGLKVDYAKLINPKNGYENNDTGNRVYRSLGKLGNTFATTNYDSWLDTEIPDVPLPVTMPAFQQDTTATAPSKRRAIFDVNDSTPAHLNQTKSVFHLHGSLADAIAAMFAFQYCGDYA